MRFPARLIVSALLLTAITGCRRWRFPEVPANYREYAYVANADADSVSVLDLVELRQIGTLQTGRSPIAVVANPLRDEIYVVNRGDNSLSVIDAQRNEIVAALAVHSRPSAIAVSADGDRAYVANAGSNTISVLDLRTRQEIATLRTGDGPEMVRITPDGRTLVVSDRASGSVDVYAAGRGPVGSSPRASFSGCAAASDIALLHDSSKAFVACSGSDSVLAIGLAAAPGSWSAKQDQSLLTDRLLARLRVGKAPVHLALKPDGGEIFVSNAGGNNISEIATSTNEVGGSYPIGDNPGFALVSADGSTLWVANTGADSVSIYSIDDGRLTGSVRIGSQPAALALSADEHLLLATNAKSGDVAVVRTHDRNGPTLFTMLPSGSRPGAIAIKSLRLK